MKKIVIVLLAVLIPVTCYAHAGFFDRYLDMMNVLYADLKAIFVSQLVVFLLIRFNWLKISKKIRMRILLFAKRLCKYWYINLLAAWALSLFVLTSYVYVFSMSLFLFAIVPLALFVFLYMVVLFRKKMRERWLSGLKALYFYLIASIGQLLVFIVLLLANVIMLYGPYNTFNDFWWVNYSYRVPLYILAKGMWDLSLFMAIPYLLLISYNVIKNKIIIIR